MEINLKVEKITETLFYIKTNNLIFKLNYELLEPEVVSMDENIPTFNIEDYGSVKYFEKNYFILPILNQYGHTLIDSCAKALILKDMGEDFTVLLFGNHLENSTWPLQRAIEILNSLNIKYEIIYDRVDFIKLESGYVFLEKQTQHQKTGAWVETRKIPVQYWIFDEDFRVKYIYLNNKIEDSRIIIEKYRKYLFDENIVQDKKLYITRKDSQGRRFINDENLEKFFVNKGYIVLNLSEISFLNQVMFFNSASHIVLQSGTSIANQIFCHEGTKILEISTHPEIFIVDFPVHSKQVGIDIKTIEAVSKNDNEIIDIILNSKSSFVKEFL